MYYVNREQIERILGQIPDITEGLRLAATNWDGSTSMGMIQERSLHLAIEVVTDVGSCLIDGFIMRDAGSYEDIISIIHEETVFSGDEVYKKLIELVALRKPLVQDYYEWSRNMLHPLTPELPDILEGFAVEVRHYLQKELGDQQTLVVE